MTKRLATHLCALTLTALLPSALSSGDHQPSTEGSVAVAIPKAP